MSDSFRQGNGIRSTLAWRFDAQHVRRLRVFLFFNPARAGGRSCNVNGRHLELKHFYTARTDGAGNLH